MKTFLMLLLCANLLGSPQDLVVGTAGGYAPYASMDTQGNLEGFDIDIANLLAKKLGKKLVLKDCGSMPSLLLSLKQKKANILIWAISITQERMNSMDMVYYQGEKTTQMPFLFWGKVPEGIRSIADLADKDVCIEAGTYQEDIVKKLPKARAKYVDKISDAVLEIRFGKSLATAIDPSLIKRFTTQYPEIKVVNLPLPIQEQSFGYGICINKTDIELSAAIRKAVDELIAEGKIEELEKKWNMVKE
jgi:polar amino acid transport system substrate-binding protein